jgi:hypothetical protein
MDEYRFRVVRDGHSYSHHKPIHSSMKKVKIYLYQGQRQKAERAFSKMCAVGLLK